MNNAERVKHLWARIKERSHSLDDLSQIFTDYKSIVSDISADEASNHIALRKLIQEFPDLERLIGRKYDAILKGRLIDAISILKKRIEELETQDNSEPLKSADEEAGNEKRVRNMPSLGMD